MGGRVPLQFKCWFYVDTKVSQYTLCPKGIPWYQGRNQDFELGGGGGGGGGGGQTTNHTGEDQKKEKVFTIRFRIFDREGARNLFGDQFRVGGAKPQMETWSPTSKYGEKNLRGLKS